MSPLARARGHALTLFACWLSAIYSGQLHAALPSLTGITPFAANPGSSTPVKFAGKLDGMTRHVWCDDSAIVFSLPDASGNATVTVAPEAQPGLHLVRFVNSEGASQPVRFSIGLLPLLDEKEPNDDVSGAQDISKLPAWIQGKLDKPGDVDHFALYLKKGSPLLLRMDGYSLGSPVDLILHVLDAKGVKVATYSDGRNLDPQGVFTPPDDGRYILQIAGFAHPPAADVNFTGSAVCNYQIALSTGPAVDRVFPAAVSSTGKGSVEVRGVGVAPKTRVEIAPASMVGDREIVDVLPKGAIASIAVLRTAYAIATPVHASEDQPASVTVPCVVGGYFEKPAAVAAYKIVLKKGERMAARFWARSLGLDAEGELVVKGPTGEQVAANPNPSDIFSEPSVVWTAAVDGDYTLLVRDLFGRGGERYEFVVEIAPPTPSFSVEVADGKPLRVETGKTQVIKTKVVFANGWKEPLVLRVNGLPDGVFAPEVTVPEKGGDVDITLKCASNAPSGTALARIAAWTKTSPPRFVVASYSLRNELKRGDTSSDFAKDIWVTVTPPGAPVPQDPAKKK